MTATEKEAGERSDPSIVKVSKDEMVSYLTSTGKIRANVARSLYDNGLDRYELLIEGDVALFLGFKGVGPKTAEVLIELGKAKKADLDAARPVLTCEELLNRVPRMTKKAKGSLASAGLDTIQKLASSSTEDLQKLDGIGPKLSVSILEAAKAAPPEPPAQTGAPAPIEEATGLPMDEVPKPAEGEVSGDKKGFFDRFLDGFKKFFSTKKVDEGVKTETPAPTPQEGGQQADAAANATPEPASAGTSAPPTPEDAKGAEGPEGPAAQEQPQPAVTVEAGPEEPPKAGPVTPSPEQPVTTAGAEAAPAPAPQPSFFQKLKGFFSGKKEEAKPEASLAVTPTEVPKEGAGTAPEAAPVALEGQTAEAAPAGPGSEVTAPADNALINIHDIPGIEPVIADKLIDAGYLNVQELKEAVPEDLVMIDGIDMETAKKVCGSLKGP